MLRSARFRILLISAFAAPVALGQGPGQGPKAGPQNSDISFLAGPVFGGNPAIAPTGDTVKVTGAFSFQSGFAHILHSYSFADLWFEFPSTSAFRDGGNLPNGTQSISYSEFYGTPGVRLHVPVGSRVSFYGAAGGGYGSFQAELDSVSQGGPEHRNSNYHGVIDFGGGMDFRLTRLLSLRGEIRDFVTGRDLGGVDGRNHVLTLFGMAVHF
jgi:opacity protein-like surface antigen